MSNDNLPKIKKQSPKLYFDTKSVRNNIICVLIGSIGFTSVLIILSPDDKKVIICDIIEPLAALSRWVFQFWSFIDKKQMGLWAKRILFLVWG